MNLTWDEITAAIAKKYKEQYGSLQTPFCNDGETDLDYYFLTGFLHDALTIKDRIKDTDIVISYPPQTQDALADIMKGATFLTREELRKNTVWMLPAGPLTGLPPEGPERDAFMRYCGVAYFPPSETEQSSPPHNTASVPPDASDPH